jgi:tRNA(Ile)-lysidine synthase
MLVQVFGDLDGLLALVGQFVHLIRHGIRLVFAHRLGLASRVRLVGPVQALKFADPFVGVFEQLLDPGRLDVNLRGQALHEFVNVRREPLDLRTLLRLVTDGLKPFRGGAMCDRDPPTTTNVNPKHDPRQQRHTHKQQGGLKPHREVILSRAGCSRLGINLGVGPEQFDWLCLVLQVVGVLPWVMSDRCKGRRRGPIVRHHDPWYGPSASVSSRLARQPTITCRMDGPANQSPSPMEADSDAAQGNEPQAATADAAIAAIVTDWRLLTGGTSRTIADIDRRTLVACSGGADSAALALALATAASELVIAHVVHDLRPTSITRRDRDSAHALAVHLGLPFVEAEIHPAAQGSNVEATARRFRYDALAQLAMQHGCRFIATAHHADDQLETLLMALMRGAGPRGLSGIASTRPLEDDLSLIRPMLHVTSEDARRICTHANWSWVEDETNNDTTRLRAALRKDVIPRLERLRPGVAHRAVTAAKLQAGAADLIDKHVNALLAIATRSTTQIAWPRTELADQPPIVLGSLIRKAVEETCTGKGLDQFPSRTITAIAAAISDRQGRERVFSLQNASIQITKASVFVRRKT